MSTQNVQSFMRYRHTYCWHSNTHFLSSQAKSSHTPEELNFHRTKSVNFGFLFHKRDAILSCLWITNWTLQLYFLFVVAYSSGLCTFIVLITFFWRTSVWGVQKYWPVPSHTYSQRVEVLRLKYAYKQHRESEMCLRQISWSKISN
jgi:hypothetical protein